MKFGIQVQFSEKINLKEKKIIFSPKSADYGYFPKNADFAECGQKTLA